MSLTKLPPEILVEIVAYLGSQFFREDMGRLTLFKMWHPIAVDQIKKHVILGNRAIVSAYESKPWPEPVSNMVPAWAKNGTRELTLDLSDWYSCAFDDTADDDTGEEPMHTVLHRFVRNRRIPYLCLVKCLKKLHTLRLIFRSGDTPPYGFEKEYVTYCSVAPIMMVDQIASLENSRFTRLELEISDPGPFPRDYDGYECMCVEFNHLLVLQSQLKEFRIGLWTSCDELLGWRCPAENTSSLEVLLIYCRLGDDRTGSGVCDVNWTVNEPTRQKRDRAPERLAKASEEWVKAMKAPRMVRIIWYDHRSDWSKERFTGGEDGCPRNLVRDCLTGETRSLRLTDDWESKGELVGLRDPVDGIARSLPNEFGGTNHTASERETSDEYTSDGEGTELDGGSSGRLMIPAGRQTP